MKQKELLILVGLVAAYLVFFQKKAALPNASPSAKPGERQLSNPVGTITANPGSGLQTTNPGTLGSPPTFPAPTIGKNFLI